MKKLLFVFAVSFCVPIFHASASSLVLSEFMADNTRTLTDDDGDSEDWIEVRNISGATVNLDGWYLSDAAGNLTKWRFPATNLNAGAQIIVFASNKDRRVPGRPLHTNFRLDPGGEFLALVEPNGVTIATRFAPYPRQVPNVSFGLGLITTNTTLINTGAALRALVPTSGNGGNALADTWKGGAEPFTDTAWRSGVSGVGFSAANAPSLVATSALQVRLNFDAPPVGTAVLDTKPIGTAIPGVNTANGPAFWAAASTDDSPLPVARSGVMQFIAPSNSQITLPANPAFSTLRGSISFWMRSLGWFGPGQGPAVLLDRQAVTSDRSNGGVIQQGEDGRLTFLGLVGGTNVASVTSLASASDGRWHHIAVVYDQAAGGFASIYIDGALDRTAPNLRAWTWPAAQIIELGRSHVGTPRKYNGFLDDFRIYNRDLSAAEVAEIAAGDGGVPATDLGLNLEADMLNVNASAFVRVPFNVADTNAFSLLTLRVRHNDGFVAWINGRLVGEVNAPSPLAFDSAATATHSIAVGDSVTFGSGAGLLRQGPNILAIQGLNRAANDPTFLVYPELIATSVPIESTNGLYFTRPSPGAPNVGGSTNTGPVIGDVAHSPNVPLDDEDLVVTAQIAPTFNPVQSVTLRYLIMYSTEVAVPMNDAGTGGDRVAGDNIWTGIVPASVSTNGQMIRYSINALDTLNNASRWPLFYNPTNSERYLGTVVNPSYVQSKLPVFHMFINPADLGRADGEDPGARMSFFYDGEFYDNVRIELRGNTSAGFRKKAHRLEFNRDHRFRHLPGFPRVGDTSLLGESADPSYLRHNFCFWLLEAMGVPSPFNYPVRVQNNAVFYQLALHSDVMGIEQLERLGYNPNGALYKAIGNLVPGFNSTGGFEKRTRLHEDRSDYLALANGIRETNATFSIGTRTTNLFDMVDVPNAVNYLAAARWSQEADDVWANMTIYRDTEGDQLWRIIPFDMNVSWGQLYCGDNPSVFGNFIATNDIYKAHPLYGGSTVPVQGGGAGYNRMYDAIITVPETREMLLRRMRTMLDKFIEPPETHPLALTLEKRVIAFSNLVHPEAILDRLRWGWENTVVGGSPAGPYCFGTNQWVTNHLPRIISEFIVPRRKHWYVTHSIANTARPVGINTANNAGIPLAQPTDASVSVSRVEFAPSSGNQDEEFICITNGNPYAVDISGWKLGGGVNFTFIGGTIIPSNRVMYVSPNTLAFRNRSVAPRGGMALFVVGPYKGQLSARGEPLTIHDDRGRLVYTNTFTGNPSPAQQFLRVTELMYNPSPLGGSTIDAQEFEYVEVRNISASQTLSLAGVRFINGIEFNFTGSAVTSLAPGERALVVKNLAAFTARYGVVPRIAGQYSGFFDNRGERVQLVDAGNEEIHDFTYNNSWYPITDGLGFSLVTADENQETGLWDRKEGWRRSSVVNGSPGQVDPISPVFLTVLVNEVLTHTDAPLLDAVELFNPWNVVADIGNWYLSDDRNTPKKYRIPAGTTIQPGGYIVFDESQFNRPTNAPTSFSFSSKGDEVYLFSGNAAGDLTGYIFGYQFGAAENGVTFGRYTNSQTNVLFIAQSSPTLGAANAGPKVGPLQISEIHYHPTDLPGGLDNSADEFVEIANSSSSDVLLALSAGSTNTWRIRGGIDFNFPVGVTLPVNGRLVVVNFDPSYAPAAAAFRAKFGVPAGVNLYGPYSGKLDNSSDTVRLLRPDAPELNEVPYIVVDEVGYRDDAPWPVLADGSGASLTRRLPNAFGNDPASWMAAAPTPGGGLTGTAAPLITQQPQGGSAIATLSTSFSVNVAGVRPIGYQWRLNGANIDGATNQTLTLENLQYEQAGAYSVVAFNSVGTTVSSNAILNVLLPAVITQQPASVAVRPGTNVTFSIAAVSSSAITYQWRLNGVDIPGATGTTLTRNNVGLDDRGRYSVRITDSVGTIESLAATLTLLINPLIVAQPLSVEAPAGANVTFSIAVSNTATLPLSVRWRRNGVSILTNTINSYVDLYTATNVQTSGAIYTAVVANQALVSGIISSNAVVTLITDSDGDGLPDAFETANGLNPNNAADATLDPDGDTMSNQAEYIAGTDPRDRQSVLRVTRILPVGAATIEFNAVSNRTYRVQFKDAITNRWSNLVAVAAAETNRVETVVDPTPPPVRFYRLSTPGER